MTCDAWRLIDQLELEIHFQHQLLFFVLFRFVEVTPSTKSFSCSGPELSASSWASSPSRYKGSTYSLHLLPLSSSTFRSFNFYTANGSSFSSISDLPIMRGHFWQFFLWQSILSVFSWNPTTLSFKQLWKRIQNVVIVSSVVVTCMIFPHLVSGTENLNNNRIGSSVVYAVQI